MVTSKLPFILLIIFVITLLFTTILCAANDLVLKPNQYSRREYVNNHPELSPEIKQAILEGKVIEGMAKDDVIAAWGEPTTIDDLSTNKNAWWYEENSEWWYYKASFFSSERSKSVKFKNGIVVRVQIRGWREK